MTVSLGISFGLDTIDSINGIINLVSPSIAGTPEKDQELTVDNGIWEETEELTFTYQWYNADPATWINELVTYEDEPIHDGMKLIVGANSSSYTLNINDAGLIVFCKVTAHKGKSRKNLYTNFLGPIEGLSPQTISLLSRYEIPASPSRKQLVDDVIVPWVNAGIFSKLDSLYMIAGENFQQSSLNWIGDFYNLTQVGSTTFTIDRGITLNGSSYLNFNINPNINNTKYSLNSASAGFWSRTQNPESGVDLGSISGSGLLGRARNNSNQIQIRINDGTTSNAGSNLDGSGLFTFVRNNSVKRVYKNTTQIGSDITSTPTVMPSSIILGMFGNGNFTTREYAAAFSGQALTTEDITALYNGFNTYLTQIGAI